MIVPQTNQPFYQLRCYSLKYSELTVIFSIHSFDSQFQLLPRQLQGAGCGWPLVFCGDRGLSGAVSGQHVEPGGHLPAAAGDSHGSVLWNPHRPCVQGANKASVTGDPAQKGEKVVNLQCECA